jgi:hypothetical protein
MRAAPCHRRFPAPVAGLAFAAHAWLYLESCKGGPVPTLFRFIVVVAILVGLGFAAVFSLATFVNPEPREIAVPVPSSRLSSP